MAEVDTSPQQQPLESLEGSTDAKTRPLEVGLAGTGGFEYENGTTRDALQTPTLSLEGVVPLQDKGLSTDDLGNVSEKDISEAEGQSREATEREATDNLMENEEEAGGDDWSEGEAQPPPTPTLDSDSENLADAEPLIPADPGPGPGGDAQTRTLHSGLGRPSGGSTAAAGGSSTEEEDAKPSTTIPQAGGDSVNATHRSSLAELPPVVRGQVRGQQMTSSITDAVRHAGLPSPKATVKSRRPAKCVRLNTVSLSPARNRPAVQGPSLYYEEPQRPQKVITWDEATNARPPLRIDMEGPTAWTYSPRGKPLNETNAPAFTFGTKCYPEKCGGSRTSWSKTWFQSPHVWTVKVDFSADLTWPSPNHYPKGSALGARQRTMPEAPSYTFGHKLSYSVKAEAAKEPAPNEYKRHLADKLVMRSGPAFTHQFRRDGTQLWGSCEVTPGPAAYNPYKSFPERPAFTIQGIRREKSHVLGPYSAL